MHQVPQEDRVTLIREHNLSACTWDILGGNCGDTPQWGADPVQAPRDDNKHEALTLLMDTWHPRGKGTRDVKEGNIKC